MKKLLFCILLCTSIIRAEFRDIHAYGQLVYTALQVYMSKHPTNNYQDVNTYLQSSDMQPIFHDATVSCYNRLQVLRAAFQIAVQPDQDCQSIQQGLHDAIQAELMWRAIKQYALYGVCGFDTLV